MCYFVYYLSVMMCVCRILIKSTYLLTYVNTSIQRAQIFARAPAVALTLNVT